MLRKILQYTCDIRPRPEFFLGGGGCSEGCVTELINSNYPWEGGGVFEQNFVHVSFYNGTKVFKIFQLVFILEKRYTNNMKIDN